MRCLSSDRAALRLSGVLWLVLLVLPLAAHAGGKITIDDTRWVSIGAGLRASANFVEDAAPNGTDYSKDFTLNNARLYLNGQLFKGIFATFNTEYSEANNAEMRVLDGLLRFEFADAFNVWLGRFLPPSDRANLDGPFYLLNLDFPGVSNFPAIFAGRDDGLAVWGQVLDKRLKYQVGVFEGVNGGPNTGDDLLFAARLVYNLFDPEPGYYNASTYFGAKKILAVGATVQFQSDAAGTVGNSEDYQGFNVDVLFEYPLLFGTVTLEAAYYNYDFGNQPLSGQIDGEAFYAQGGFLFPQKIGIGQLQPVFRVQHFDVDAPTTASDSTHFDFGLNYIISGFDARVMFEFTQVQVDDGKDFNEIQFLAQFQY